MSDQLISRQDYADQVFTGLDQRQDELLACEFYDCEFARCSFTETVFRECRWVNCTFRECDLSLVQVPESSFSAVHFEATKLIGVDWTQADWSGAQWGKPLLFERCALNHSTFIGLKLAKIQLRDCTAVDVDFRDTDLSEANLAGTDLGQSLFTNTNLTKADLSKARNYRIAPGQNTLTGAKFSLPEAMSLLYQLDIVLVDDDFEE